MGASDALSRFGFDDLKLVPTGSRQFVYRACGFIREVARELLSAHARPSRLLYNPSEFALVERSEKNRSDYSSGETKGKSQHGLIARISVRVV
jgi:hypothetical protein